MDSLADEKITIDDLRIYPSFADKSEAELHEIVDWYNRVVPVPVSRKPRRMKDIEVSGE